MSNTPPTMPVPAAIAEAGGPQPVPVSLRIVDVPGGVMLEVATPQFIVFPFLSQTLMQWLEEQLRARNANIVPATPSLAAQLVELAQNGKKGH